MISLAAIAVAGLAVAAPIRTSVLATDNIYNASTSDPQGGGAAPVQIALPANTQCMMVRSRHVISLNDGSGDNLNDSDGVGAAVAMSSNTGVADVSGIQAPNAGYLVALFTPVGGPSGAAPAALDFTQIGTNFSKLSPLVDQTFFVGDGLTGDKSGTQQGFVVPSGAASVYFGISDACNYNGPPSCYQDNVHSFTVTVKFSRKPCP